jgi:hypothetical protein
VLKNRWSRWKLERKGWKVAVERRDLDASEMVGFIRA